MKKLGFVKKLLLFLLCYALLAAGFYWIVADDWKLSAVSTDAVSPQQAIELTPGTDVQQTFPAPGDLLDGFTLRPAVLNPSAQVVLSISKGEDVLWTNTIAGNRLSSGSTHSFVISPALSTEEGETYTLRLSSETGGVAFFLGTTRSAGKFEIETETAGLLTQGEEALAGELVMTLSGSNKLDAHRLIIPIAVLIGLALCALMLHVEYCRAHRRPHIVLTMQRLFMQYKFLLKQLIIRDFKVKYKSSTLGFLWSILNPIMSMTVYYFVFSTLFRNSLPHFPAFLMTGIVLFSYFSDSTTLGMISIVGNAGLITKVYIPKYIFPLSKVLSSVINLCISMVPLLGVTLLSGLPLTKSLLLFPVVILLVIAFNFGVSLILSTMNTFFRDTQFLWSVVLTMLNFLTPVFYPESIIPARFLPLYRLNPLYQFLSFLRSIVIDGVAPAPASFLWCILAALIPLALGLYVFRKKQDQFVLHL